MILSEIRDSDKYLKGEAIQGIGWVFMALGALTILIGERKSDKSIRATAEYDEKGNLIEDSVKYY